MRHAVLSLLAAMVLPATVHAALSNADEGAWTSGDDGLRASAAGITLPQSAGSLSLTKSGEISEQGEGLDNYAQFASGDGVIQATAYVYMPSYADAAISAYMTDKAIHEHFGPQTRRTAYGATAAGRYRNAAIRSVYNGADGQLVTEAAFIHAGRWMIKLRVTGPVDRAQDVKFGMDALLGGMQFDKDAVPTQVAARDVGPCPVTDGPGARIVKDRTAAQDQIGDLAFPHDGRDILCVRGTVQVGDASYDMLQATGDGLHSPVLVPLNDAGKVMRFDHMPAGDGYRLTVHQVGRTDVYGAYDRIPTRQQIAAIIDGSDKMGATLLQSTAHAADGRATISTNSGGR
ncbi:MAG TPA: hypothetical protein VF509_04875 [Sphingobium sp.]